MGGGGSELNLHHFIYLFYHIKFIPPIPIWVWEIDLSESWLKGICDHTPDEDHMGSEHKCDICNWTYDPYTYLNIHNKFYIVYIICGRLGDEHLLYLCTWRGIFNYIHLILLKY